MGSRALYPSTTDEAARAPILRAIACPRGGADLEVVFFGLRRIGAKIWPSESKPSRPGHVVRQPDGPAMVVDRVEGDFVHCVWFAGDRLMRDGFRSQRLELLSP